ncbi:MAG: phage antirepressor N-terminal domain-containing protein [Aeromonas sp.]
MTIQQHQPQTKVSVTANHSMSVPFRGDNLYLVECDGQPYVPMKPVVEGMGLAWQVQHRKLASKFSKGIIEMVIPSAGGNQSMLCLSLRKLPAWLYSIQSGKVSIEIREKVIAYQEECDEVLWQYWTTGTATKEQVKKQTSRAKALPGGLTVEQQTSIKALVKARVESLPQDKQDKAAVTCWSAIKSKFGMSYKAIEPEQFSDVLSLVARLPLEGELLIADNAPAAPLHIHFPAETASPHDRKFGNDWFTARTILDERNRAPEQELLVLLEASGFDVTGASIRIHAMYGIIKQFLGVQRELAIASHHSSTITDIIYSATRERGDNVSFTGDTCGKTYGGQSTRTLPHR